MEDGMKLPSISLLGYYLRPPFSQSTRKRRQSRLHPDLDSLEGTESNIGQKLGTGTSSQVDNGLVHIGKHRIPVKMFKDLVEAILAPTLEAVTNKSRRPAEEDASKSFIAEDGRPCFEIGRVQLRIDLASGLDKVEGSY